MPNVPCTPHLGWAEWDTFEAYFGETFAQVAQFAKTFGATARR
jgi:D-3-phosphoglycerate dehydrogenase / 2-oxoglutarate reductase